MLYYKILICEGNYLVTKLSKDDLEDEVEDLR